MAERIERYIDSEELKNRFSVGTKLLREIVNQNNFPPFIKIEGKRWWREEDINKWMTSLPPVSMKDLKLAEAQGW